MIIWNINVSRLAIIGVPTQFLHSVWSVWISYKFQNWSNKKNNHHFDKILSMSSGVLCMITPKGSFSLKCGPSHSLLTVFLTIGPKYTNEWVPTSQMSVIPQTGGQRSPVGSSWSYMSVCLSVSQSLVLSVPSFGDHLHGPLNLN